MIPARDGPRRTRDRNGERRRDRWQQAGVVILAAIIGTAAGIAADPRHDAPAAARPATRPATRPKASTAPRPVRDQMLLFGHRAPDGHLDLLVALGLTDRATSGTVVLVPAATLVEVPSLETQALADVARFGSPELLVTSVENALGVGFDRTLLVDDAQLAALLAPAARFDVEFRQAVRVDDDAGTIAFLAGTHEVAAAEAVRLLVGAEGRGELEHLVTVQAVLEGWWAALADRAAATATLAVDDRSGTFLRASDAAIRYETLPVDRLALGGAERFRLRKDDVDALMRRAFPWARLGGGHRPRVEILNGTGAVGLTQDVAARIVPAGAEMILTGNVPGFGVIETLVVYYRDADARAARRLAVALGVGRVAKATRPIDVVDLTVIVGADFIGSQPGP